ncbi:MAG: Ribosomal RNA small subunit methyltransferase E [Chlamydiae bacterium]|nr:Ribosomal RNA small subunit methyltransferase E [Chlamydiota bacterium]
MPAYRFFIDQTFEVSQQITLDGFEHKHLKQVMRVDEEDEIEITDGKGNLARAVVLMLDKNHTTVEIKEVNFFPKKHNLILLQCMPKASKLDLILEKGTELGLSEIHICMGEKSVQKLPTEKLERLRSITISALKQSGRIYLPKIKIIRPIAEWENAKPFAFFGDLSYEAPLLGKELPQNQEAQTFYFCNGPEAGFSKRELKKLRQKNFKGISLHTNILRTETAPLVFLSAAFQHLLAQGNHAIVN